MIAKLFSFFGMPGLLALLAGVAAVAVAGAGWPRPRRERWFLAALGCALACWLLGSWSSGRVSDIRLDRSDEIREAQEAQQKLLGVQEANRPAGGTGLRFAEDAPGEAAGETIMTPKELSGAAPPAVPAYREGGKRKRAEGKIDTETAALAERAGIGADVESSEDRQLKLDDYRLVNRLDRLGMLAAKILVLLLVLVLAVDFLRRFNHPFNAFFPIPIAGRWLSQFHPPELVVEWVRPADDELRRYLETIVRKGHTFFYFGDRADGIDMRRLRFRKWGLWRLPRLAVGSPGVPRDPEFLLDAVWFGRYAVSVGRPDAETVLAELTRQLSQRQRTRAWASRMPHLVWDMESPPPAHVLDALTVACRETGVRWIEVTG